MRYLSIASLIFISLSSIVQAEDVIYQKDGSILKGTLIEQDFVNGKYKIQLLGGSIFVVLEDNIAKITKESALQPSKNTELEQVVIESRNTLNSKKSTKQFSLKAFNGKSILAVPQKDHKNIHSTFYIGTLSHKVTEKYDARVIYNIGYQYEVQEVEESAYYKGIKLGFQKVYNKNIAGHYALNIGSLKSIEISDKFGNALEPSVYSELESDDYLGLSASIIASTNLQKGWQFFTGLGLLHDKYSTDTGDQTYTSLGLDLGMGYAWKKVQVGLQYQGVIAGDYDSGLDVSNLHLQLGINL